MFKMKLIVGPWGGLFMRPFLVSRPQVCPPGALFAFQKGSHVKLVFFSQGGGLIKQPLY